MNKEVEIWKFINGYEDLFEISSKGKIRTLYKKHMNKYIKLPQYIYSTLTEDKDGYLTKIFEYYKNNKKNIKIHRLVATYFIPNPLNLPCVNHINGVKSDNRVENLEWVSVKENNEHSYRVLGRVGVGKKKKKIVQRNRLTNEVIKIWDCARDIRLELGFSAKSISCACYGRQKTAYGFIWEFYKEKDV